MEHSPSEVELLKAELAELRAEVAGMKASAPMAADNKIVDVEKSGQDTAAANRRGFLRLAGAAAIGGAAVAVVGAAQPAAAATGDPLLAGQGVSATTTTASTRIVNPGTTTLGLSTFVSQNYTSGGAPIPPADHRVALAGLLSGNDNSGTAISRTGVYGRTSATVAAGGQGVFGGANGSTENTFADSYVFGVAGTAPDDGFGVFGYGPTGTGTVGVLGRADAGIGVIASSFTGVSLLVRDGGRLQQQLRAVGAPTTGAFTAGEQIRDGNADLYICTASGTPGTWRKVTAQHPAFANAGGSINLLSKPIRLVDSRGTAGIPITNGGVKFAPGTPLVAQITGTVSDGLSVPAGAKGILGNLTATESNGPGFALVWPSNVSIPSTSNINYSAVTGNPAIANYFISGLDTTGKLSIQCAANATHLLLDVFGFIF